MTTPTAPGKEQQTLLWVCSAVTKLQHDLPNYLWIYLLICGQVTAWPLLILLYVDRWPLVTKLLVDRWPLVTSLYVIDDHQLLYVDIWASVWLPCCMWTGVIVMSCFKLLHVNRFDYQLPYCMWTGDHQFSDINVWNRFLSSVTVLYMDRWPSVPWP